MPRFHMRHLIATLYREGQSHYSGLADGEVEKHLEVKKKNNGGEMTCTEFDKLGLE